MKRFTTAIAVSCMLAATAFGVAPARAADPAKVLDTYADIAHAMYEDALITAETLQSAVAQLVTSPSPPGSPRVSLISRRKATVSATPPLTTGKARSTLGRWTKG